MRAVAYHEAGHTVVALALGCPVLQVAIATRGVTVHGNVAELVYTHAPDRRVAAFHMAAIALAGAIAQQRACPGSRCGDHVDRALAWAAAASVADDPTDFLRRLHVRTEQSLASNWRCVEVLATALMARQRLTGAEVRALTRRTAA